MSVRLRYSRSVKIINKGSNPITYPTSGTIVNGDLDAYVLRLELTNSTVDEVNSLLLTLRIDPAGTFIRSGPILIDEHTQDKYLIHAQVIQDPGGPNEVKGKLFRFEISSAIIKEDQVNGEVLQIIGRGLEYIFKETLDSQPLVLQSPHTAFFSRLENYAHQATNILISVDSVDIELPKVEILKRDWIPSGPRTTHDCLREIIERVALAPASGGVLEDFYWDAIPHDSAANTIKLICRKFGTNNSGVTINPQNFSNAEQKDKSYITDNKEYKNYIVLRGRRNSGTLPMNQARFASDEIHARFRQVWSSTSTYEKDDQVRHSFGGNDRYYKSKVANNINHIPPSSGSPAQNSFWIEDFIKNQPSNISPWTINKDDMVQNLCKPTSAGNYDPAGVGSTYYGFCVDHNFVRANYDRANDNDEFETITMKWVTESRTSPPVSGSPLLYHGQRYLVGVGSNPALWGIAGSSTFADNKIIQYDRFPNPNAGTTQIPKWKLSKAPTAGDVISNLSTGKILQWSGSAWVPKWSLESVDAATASGSYDRHTHFHPVDDVQVVEGATAGVNSAIELTYNWRVIPIAENRSSRGLWFNFWFPYPRLQSTHGTVGHEYGDDYGRMSGLDVVNLTYTSHGKKGWNWGTESEDLGTLSAISFKMRTKFISTFGKVSKVAFDNQPFRIFFVDIFDRVVYYDFRIRQNGGWQNVTIPIGPSSGMKLYFNRIDELALIYEFDFNGNFFLPEKEYTGESFKWEFVRMFGIEWMGSYGDAGEYNGHVFAGLKDIATTAVQIVSNSFGSLFSKIEGFFYKGTPQQAQDVLDAITAGAVDIDEARIAIDELRFKKDLFVVSDAERPSNCRAELYSREAEYDYLSAKRAAEARRERLKFFPQTYHLQSFGDVRVDVGDAVTITGEKVPTLVGTNPLTGLPYAPHTQVMGVQSVKHIIDEGSYSMDITAIRKFHLA